MMWTATASSGPPLELYRTLLRLRREHRIGRGEVSWVELGEEVVAFDISLESGAVVCAIANVGGARVAVPEVGDVLVRSADIDLVGAARRHGSVWQLLS